MIAKAKIVFLGSAAVCSASFGLAHAQDSTTPTTLETIVVTAGKRDQALQTVDTAISVFSGEDLVKRGVRTVEDLQTVFPGLSIGNRGSRIYSNVTVRGLSSPDYFNPTVQVYVDGVPQQPSALSQQIGDIERVEFLRGPQGTLYGANAYGGVINIITKAGTGNRFHVETTLSTTEPSVEIGGTLALVPDSLFLDFGGNFAHFSGDIDDLASGDKDINTANNGYGRARLRYAPTGGDFDAALSYSKEKLNSAEELNILQQNIDDRHFDSATIGDLPDLERDMTTVSGNWNWRLGDFTLSGTTSHQEVDVNRDFSSGPGSRYIWPQNDKATSQELRLAYDADGPISGVVGLWYMHGDFTGEKNGYPGYYGDATNAVETDSAAVFGEATWHATDRLDITAGARGTYDRSTIDASRADTFGLGQGFDFDNKADFSSIQPKIAIGYDLTGDIRLFSVLSRGYKAGGFNHSISSTIDASPYEPETAWNFEVGAKSTLLDGDLDLSASAYYIKSSDKQIYVGMIGQQFIRNAGEAYSAGLELEATWRATDALTLTGNVAIGRSEFTDFTDPYTGASYDGNRVPYTPDLIAHLYASYLIDQNFIDGSLTASAGANITSKTYFDESNSAKQSGYATFDASLDLALEGGFSGRLYVQNIADKSYKTSGYASGTAEYGTLGKARTIGLVLRKEF